ncbi:DUF5689 domain-containing protein [Chryseobacterium pennipullorum]|uniref:DUF5689 domain-containing protein n=1 Tax=Chryseobacterium pennipullorum TaxID=2258963 RepID=A0A3D9B6Q5_9FLAO|nr:DUF5689 domain-containing protein [Chryseobacterium pennipullorum]REC48926.1 hypothetical protein DRF67_05045 [Chryseobacterium pennipullorum]
MEKYNSILKYIFIAAASLLAVTGCVHDDKYDQPNLDGYDCADKKGVVIPFADVKAKYQNARYVFPEDTTPDNEADDLYMVGYVSSTDETGNIYKTIYVQDALENPTHGFTVSVDAVSTYTRYPQGSKVYIKLNGLAVGTYGGLVQLGVETGAETSATSVSRIPEKRVAKQIFRSCAPKGKIVPKLMKLADMTAANDQYFGCLIQVNDVEFDARALCTTYAPNGVTVDKTIGEGWANGKYAKTAVVRNSGYASFASQVLPSGKGEFVGIYSKFQSGSTPTYQLYVNRAEDLNMNTFPRLNGLNESPCGFNPNNLTAKTIAEIKQLAAGTTNWVQITGDDYLKAQIVANDETGNLYKYLYVEDATGGIRVNMNKTNLYLDSRFRLGKDVNIKLKNLYVRSVNGEVQLGSLFTNNNNTTQFGQIEEAEMFKYFFDSNTAARAVVPTDKTISQLTMADVGRWIRIKDVQFVNGDLGKTLTDGSSVTNRTLEDCAGNTVALRTSGQASFGSVKPGGYEVKGGKGDVYAILSVFNGAFQLWITRLANIDFDAPRCDGSIYTSIPVIYSDGFAAGGFGSDWTTVNKVGPNQFWQTSNQGNGSNYYAMMNGNAGGAGNNFANEDWLISKAVSLVGKTKAAVSFTSDVRYSGNALQVYATDNYTGDVTTTSWTPLQATLDTNANAFGDWVGSGNVDLSAFLGKNVRIAFKYTSTTSAAATWEVDDFKIKAQ